jgi:hypothetical protein
MSPCAGCHSRLDALHCWGRFAAGHISGPALQQTAVVGTTLVVSRCRCSKERHLLGRLPNAPLGALAPSDVSSSQYLPGAPCRLQLQLCVSATPRPRPPPRCCCAAAATPRLASCDAVGRSPQTGRAQDSGSLIRPMTLAATKETEPMAVVRQRCSTVLAPCFVRRCVTCCCLPLRVSSSSKSSIPSCPAHPVLGGFRSSDARLSRHLAPRPISTRSPGEGTAASLHLNAGDRMRALGTLR